MASNSLSSARASARADGLSQLDSLGSAKSEFDLAGAFSTLENDVANFIERVKANIQGLDMVVTGSIENISIETGSDGINIIGVPHLLYQDQGVQGSESNALAPNSPFKYTDKMPPVSVFIDYIKTKNIQLRNEESYSKTGKTSPHEDLTSEEAIESAAYAMARKVYREGFKPQPVFSKEIPQLVTDLTKTLGELTSSFITSSITDKNGNNLYNRTK